MKTLLSISETPRWHSRGAGNRPGWFITPTRQLCHFTDGSVEIVDAGATPLSHCARKGYDTADFVARCKALSSR